MSIDLWVSVGLAIPLAVIANIFTPKIQSWLEGRGKKRSKQRTQELQKELDELTEYQESPEKFHQYLLGVVIRATYIGSLVGIFAGITYILTRFAREFIYFDFANIVFSLTGQVVSMIGAVMIINVCGEAIRRINSLKNYSSVSSDLESKLKQSEGN